jgi:hypothetical protein
MLEALALEGGGSRQTNAAKQRRPFQTVPQSQASSMRHFDSANGADVTEGLEAVLEMDEETSRAHLVGRVPDKP